VTVLSLILVPFTLSVSPPLVGDIIVVVVIASYDTDAVAVAVVVAVTVAIDVDADADAVTVAVADADANVDIDADGSIAGSSVGTLRGSDNSEISSSFFGSPSTSSIPGATLITETSGTIVLSSSSIFFATFLFSSNFLAFS